MAIDTTITRNLGNGYVQVDVDHPKVPTRYFKVKKDKADEFCKDFKKFDTEERIFAGIKTALPILLACGIVNYGNIFRPEIVLLGGGVCAQGDELLVPLREKVNKEIYAGTYGPEVEISVATLENSAGILGAASLWM